MASPTRAFYTLDKDLRLVSASPATFAIWGKSPRDVLGRKLVEAFPYVEGNAVHQALEQALQSFRPMRLRTHSVAMGRVVDVEIYPVNEGLQVSFAPSATDGPRGPLTS